MSHSFDSTLLQRMGFKDPDRGTPAHDRACIEIATNPRALAEAAGLVTSDHRGHHVDLEVPLQKGDGKYASTVGFIDAMVTIERATSEDPHWWQQGDSYEYGSKFKHKLEKECPTATKIESRDGLQPWYTWGCNCSREAFVGANARNWRAVSLLVEVKSSIDNVGDLLRQMNLYREYKRDHVSRRGYRTGVDTYLVWSLCQGDIALHDLLDGQGYKLIVGESLTNIIPRDGAR